MFNTYYCSLENYIVAGVICEDYESSCWVANTSQDCVWGWSRNTKGPHNYTGSNMLSAGTLLTASLRNSLDHKEWNQLYLNALHHLGRIIFQYLLKYLMTTMSLYSNHGNCHAVDVKLNLKIKRKLKYLHTKTNAHILSYFLYRELKGQRFHPKPHISSL